MKKAVYDNKTKKLIYVEMTEEEIKQLEQSNVVEEPIITQDEINCDFDYRLSMIELGLI